MISTLDGWETIKVDYEGNGVTWLYMNRPEKRNAMNPAMRREMMQVLTELENDSDTRVLVLTGAGDAYCAGQDIKETFRDRDAEGTRSVSANRGPDWRYDKLYHYQKPTIAMVNGWCCGGAFTHLFSCQLAVAADEAQFCVSEINWGILPGNLVSKVLTEGLRYRDALYLALVAEPIDGKKAAEVGLVNFSVPLASLRNATLELADKVMAKNPATYLATVDALRSVRTMSFPVAREYLEARSAQLRYTDPARGRSRGMSEFLDSKSYKPGVGPFPRVEG